VIAFFLSNHIISLLVMYFMKHVQLKFNCDQPWESFDKTSDGGFCQSCEKNVVDYTQMSFNEVKKAIKNRPGGCGRFAAHHTDPAFIAEIRIPKPKFAWAAGVFILLGSTPFSALAQEKPAIIQVEPSDVDQQIPHAHNNSQKICPAGSQLEIEKSDQAKHHRTRRILYINYRFPFIHYRRPRMGRY